MGMPQQSARLARPASRRILEAVLAARERYGARRVAVVIGTSTSSIGASEEAYARLDADGRYPEDLRRPIIHTPHSTGEFVQHALGLSGISVTVATACSSSAKVFAQARGSSHRHCRCRGGRRRRYAVRQRAVRFQFAGAGVAGAVPSVRCRARGINLGEAAGFALLERDAPAGHWLRRLRRIERRTSHVDAASRRPRRARGIVRCARARRLAARADRLHQSARHGELKNDEVEAALVRELSRPPPLPVLRRGGLVTHSVRPASSKLRSVCWPWSRECCLAR